MCRGVLVDFWQNVFDQDVKVGSAEEFQAGLALGFPQVASSVDDAIALSESVTSSEAMFVEVQLMHVNRKEICA